MPILLLQVLLALVTAMPQIIEALGETWDTITSAAREGRDLTPDEVAAVAARAKAAGLELVGVVDARTGPGGDWEEIARGRVGGGSGPPA